MKPRAAFFLFLGLIVAAPVFAQIANAQTGGLMASPEKTYSRDERFAVTDEGNDDYSNATNVSISEQSRDNLPDFIRQQAELIALDCTNDKQNATAMKFYRYASDATRAGGLSVDYIIDMAGLAKKPQRSCFLGRACADGECYLIGYKSYAYMQWEKQFMVRMTAWKQNVVDGGKEDKKLSTLRVSGKDACKRAVLSDGEDPPAADDECEKDYIWLKSGLIEYRAPQPDSASVGEDAEAAGEEKTDLPGNQ